jgi:hypothetical protein
MVPESVHRAAARDAGRGRVARATRAAAVVGVVATAVVSLGLARLTVAEQAGAAVTAAGDDSSSVEYPQRSGVTHRHEESGRSDDSALTPPAQPPTRSGGSGSSTAPQATTQRPAVRTPPITTGGS